MKSVYNILIFFTILFMATLAQIQATAAAKRAANATPTLSQNLGTGSTNTSGYITDEKDSGDGYTNKGTQYQMVDKFGNIFVGKDVNSASANASNYYKQYGEGASSDPSINPTAAAKGSTSGINTGKSSISGIKSPTSTDSINGVKRTYVARPSINTKGFTDAISKSRSREEYNAGINYDALDEQNKKIADRYYTAAEKAGKLLPPKDLYENRTDEVKNEQTAEKKMFMDQAGKMVTAEDMALKAENDYIDPTISQTESERDTFISEQEKLASDTESNRLNQVRGNIMQVLAQRGVDISKLSPEQIVALSGEQGAKAFMDITEVREKTKANIKQARDNALARLNELRQRKAVSKATYERNVANINSQAEAASLNADRTASANIFAITQTKTQQARTDATQRANAVTNIASVLGLSGSQIAPVLNLINTSGTGPEQLVTVAKMISDKNSDLRKSLDANMTKAQQAELQKQLLETYKAETARISATRPRSSGGTEDLADALKEAFGKTN